ncbi:MAG: hypothetical protein JJE53_01425 [Candidatus Pacebacteria bacterium]|nr:hypothetical protein [Candidatus Paceibacterota bacterium]
MENNCCENKDKKNGEHGCCGWKNCHMVKNLLIIVIIIAAFCIGTQWGQMRAYTRGSDFGGGMMNWYR